MGPPQDPHALCCRGQERASQRGCPRPTRPNSGASHPPPLPVGAGVGPSLPNAPGRPRYGPGHWGYLPASPSRRDTASPARPLQVIYSGAGRRLLPRQPEPRLCPQRKGLMPFTSRPPLPRLELPAPGERNREGKRGSWQWLWPEH